MEQRLHNDGKYTITKIDSNKYVVRVMETNMSYVARPFTVLANENWYNESDDYYRDVDNRDFRQWKGHKDNLWYIFITDSNNGMSSIDNLVVFSVIGDSVAILTDDPIFVNELNDGAAGIGDFNLVATPANMIPVDGYSIASNANDLKETVARVANKFNNNRAIYTMYLNFEVKIDNTWVTLVSTDSKNWLENCLVSFKYNLNGSNEANEFTLELLFKPNDRNIQNINELEAKLLASCNITALDQDETVKSSIDLFENCKFIYGYGDDTELRSPLYGGRIMKYSCNLDGPNMRYTITGTSSIYAAMREIRFSDKPEWYAVMPDGPLQYIKTVIDNVFGNNAGEFANLYTVKFLQNCYDDGYKLDAVNSNDYIHITDKTIFQFLNDTLAGTTTKKCADDIKAGKDISPNTMDTFGYYVRDVKNDNNDRVLGEIVIYKVPTYESKDNDNESKTDITFNWFGNGASGYNHLVKNWKPQYDGAAIMSLASNLKNNPGNYNTMDDNGEITSIRSLGACRLGIFADDPDKGIFNTIQEFNQWSFVTQYNYKANLTTIGLPCDFFLIDLITVNALMNSTNVNNSDTTKSVDLATKHHSSGEYAILKKIDTINSSGFYSDFKLIKLTKNGNIPSGYTPPAQTSEEVEENSVDKIDTEIDTHISSSGRTHGGGGGSFDSNTSSNNSTPFEYFMNNNPLMKRLK